MNVAFGSASPATGTGAAGLATAVAELFGAEPETVASTGGSPEQNLGALRDGGVIVGHASDGDAALVYIGAICLPVADWVGDDSPIDDPDATARFLLGRYRAAGKDFLNGVNGQYAVAVIDRRSGSTLLATDPYGGRSWFVCEEAGALAFSSHLLSLARSRGRELAVDRSLEDFLLIYGFYPFGRTPYAGVRALPPGTLLEWRDGRVETATLSSTDPWEQEMSSAPNPPSEAEVVDRLHDAMVRATREQLPSRKQRVAVLLGGFDSALVAALIQRLGYEVETYSFYYQDHRFNQPHTDTLADYLGTRHNWVEIDRHVVEQGIKDFPKTFNQPTNWPNYVIQTAHLCRRVRDDGISHVYSGDGCDAVFLGYPGTYFRARVFGALPVLPGALHRALLSIAARPWLDRALGHPYRVVLNMLRALGRRMPARGYLSFRIMDEVSLHQLRKGEAPAAEKPVDALVEELSAPFGALPTLRLGYQGKAAVSPNRNKMIGSADLAGLTILAPYMHPGLKSFAVSLPEALMRPDAKTKSKVTGKYILMRMAEDKGLLPNSIIYQPKMAAVDAPIDAWYDGPMRPLLLATMRGLPFDYDEGYLNRLIDQKLSERLFRRYVMTDEVISHAASMLATYATFTAVANGPSTVGSSSA